MENVTGRIKKKGDESESESEYLRFRASVASIVEVINIYNSRLAIQSRRGFD
jgi:hypothetical protein